MKINKDRDIGRYLQGKAESTREAPVLISPTDIYEKDDAILVRCDMPGVNQEKVDITLESNELTIVGTQDVATVEGYDLLSSEYDAGTFKRTFKVSQLIDREQIKARLHNGVLDVELPKVEQAKPHKIEIATGE